MENNPDDKSKEGLKNNNQKTILEQLRKLFAPIY